MQPSALGVLALVASLLAARVGRAGDRADEVRRLLDLLGGMRASYHEAFEDGGEELESPLDLEEARLLLAEARQVNDRLHLIPPETLARLAVTFASRVGDPRVPEQLRALAADLQVKSGVTPQHLPPARPSATRGRTLFQENCSGCHGARGAGDGPDAARLKLRPADFTSVVFMRQETPIDFFSVVSLGRRSRGMPEWSQGLTLQQRWDVVAYVWGLQSSDADRADGARLWQARCASCHGGAGEGVPGAAAPLDRPGSLVERTDRMLFVGLFRGRHADTIAALTDDERWRLVGHVRALSLGGPPAPR